MSFDAKESWTACNWYNGDPDVDPHLEPACMQTSRSKKVNG